MQKLLLKDISITFYVSYVISMKLCQCTYLKQNNMQLKWTSQLIRPQSDFLAKIADHLKTKSKLNELKGSISKSSTIKHLFFFKNFQAYLSPNSI
jgi:hypothetical protein